MPFRSVSLAHEPLGIPIQNFRLALFPHRRQKVGSGILCNVRVKRYDACSTLNRFNSGHPVIVASTP